MLDHNFLRPWVPLTLPSGSAGLVSNANLKAKQFWFKSLLIVTAVCAPNPPPHRDKDHSPPVGVVTFACPRELPGPAPVPGLVSQLIRSGHHPSTSRNAAATRATTFQGGKQTLWAVTGGGRAAAPGLQVRSASPLHLSSPL